MAQFKLAYDITMGNEGGYSNHPKDRGGETYRGISRKYHPDWSGWKIIDRPEHDWDRDTLNDMARKFYRKNYWNINRLGEINSQKIANKLFDCGVNMGVKTAAKFLQRALNVANRNEMYYRDLVKDGVIGNQTLQAVNSHPRPDVIEKIVNVLEGVRYIDIAEKDKTQEAFINGWFRLRID